MYQSHSFSVEVAKQFGVDVALMLNHFSFWYKKNKGDDVNLLEGDYWVRMKMKTLQDYFPYFTERQLRYMVDKMIELKLLVRDEFNQKKNDRTKWYTLTNEAKILLNISTDKNVSKVNYKIDSLTDKNVTSIYKEVDTKDRYILLLEEVNENILLLEDLAMKNKLTIEEVKSLAIKYVKTKVGTKTLFDNRSHFLNSFSSWLQKANHKDLEKELQWFMNLFNSISKKEFVVTEEIKQRFSTQLSYGFTGDQMRRAIKNLYSFSDKNSFHKRNSYKFATPSYLLKGDNLNKYLNVQF